MRKRISIITGASGGIGREFTRLMLSENVDAIWAIARNKEKLDALKDEFGDKVTPLSIDLANPLEARSIKNMLEAENPVIAYLINNAGIARMGSHEDFTLDEIEASVSINCTAPVILCSLCIPYMEKGSRILNISSAASFQPLPYLNLYSATKVFERYYSRALNMELKRLGIISTAVCPSWVDTDLLAKEVNGKQVKFPGIVSAERVARQALYDTKKGKDMSVCSLYVKFEHLLAKIFPQKNSMNTWIKKIKEYI